MDSKGWIPIDLIASFNRVKQLTTDAQMVKDVLSLSSLVEIRDDHVRLANRAWKSYVLPNAKPSALGGDDDMTSVNASARALSQHQYGEHYHPGAQGFAHEAEKDTIEEEEEDDVEFVLNREENPLSFDRERGALPAHGRGFGPV